MGPTDALARFVAELRYDDLLSDVVDAAKIAIADGVSVMMAGSAQPLAAIVGDYARDLGGAERCTVAGRDFKTNAPAASFANGVFGHCLDFEIQGRPPTHGTSSGLPTALALAEEAGASGRTIIESYVVGWEVQARIRSATAPVTNPAYHPPGLVGPLGAAAAGSRVLGLDAQHTSTALGIAASRTGGLTANTGTMVKSTHPGNAARMGAEAAMLAKAGFTASADVLETRHGFGDALFGGDVDWASIFDGLGERFRLVDPGFDIKRFPAQIHMQRPIESVLNLRQSHELRADAVESLTVHMRGEGHSGAVPKSGLDGKFSVEYCAAAALLDGHVGIDTFTDERRFASDMEALLPRVRVVSEPDLAGAEAVAMLKNGDTVSGRCIEFLGSIGNPMNPDDRKAKFMHCAEIVLDGEAAERLFDTLGHLEDVDDVSDLMAQLVVNAQ
ncbi:MAG: MmgE/PrpD family protein [SAR202 cluster bacterium]|nr:hypothetical protein [Chloroflexota bacterium]MDP6665256.1 MmgE/PrpD family protein [SAR202 cluster bacterium]MQG58615.1 MmgE/PrpD family protein [SAR202 cluster bacterium]MQG67953.1 MmgE/PrpD family protein [SAR202 cluster bacterium]|tara:strand:+ start:7302 stop:8633 length:1332 start_codon:yes stop_codon:yes gene_type:complete